MSTDVAERELPSLAPPADDDFDHIAIEPDAKVALCGADLRDKQWGTRYNGADDVCPVCLSIFKSYERSGILP